MQHLCGCLSHGMLTLPAQIKNSSTSRIFQHNLVCVTWKDALSKKISSCKSSDSTVASNYIFITCESKTGQQLIVISSRQGIMEEIWFYFRRGYLCLMTWIDWSFMKCQIVVLRRKSAGLPRCIFILYVYPVMSHITHKNPQLFFFAQILLH